jgi:hypothetical protein
LLPKHNGRHRAENLDEVPSAGYSKPIGATGPGYLLTIVADIQPVALVALNPGAAVRQAELSNVRRLGRGIGMTQVKFVRESGRKSRPAPFS